MTGFLLAHAELSCCLPAALISGEVQTICRCAYDWFNVENNFISPYEKAGFCA